MKTLRKAFLALLFAAVCAAGASALTVAEVMEGSTEFAGKMATVMLPNGWKKGTFDSSTWLDFKAPVGTITTKTVRFDVVIGFEDPNRAATRDAIQKECEQAFPGYTIKWS